jgi:hypothetical protein
MPVKDRTIPDRRRGGRDPVHVLAMVVSDGDAAHGRLTTSPAEGR